MQEITLREMKPSDKYEGSELICLSHNTWYQLHAMSAPFGNIPASAEFFVELYGALDGSHGVVAENSTTGRLAGLCFYQVRSTHVSVAMMSVHPNYFQRGVGKALLKYITDMADKQKKPVRLVSSTLNVDSFSLYSRAGFIPRYVYQDVLTQVPNEGLTVPALEPKNIRNAHASDIPGIVKLEYEINGMQREPDFQYLIDSEHSLWHASVIEGEAGSIEGFLASCEHPDIRMLGPSIARTEEQLLSLIMAELNTYRGHAVLQLVPAVCREIVHSLYTFGGRNIEMHLLQIRGAYTPLAGIYTPTYMFESG